ncbi:MAG: ATP-binding protein, partial [Planctomycetes bacterium]|nr:ATP-binding protein [Planctomycetota bacterium]
RVDIIVDGVTNGAEWSCGLEFDYANRESFYCRPLRSSDGKRPDRMVVPEEAAQVRVAYLPPMSGLAALEEKHEPGRINVLIGEGQTAQVLRNLCYLIHEKTDRAPWQRMTDHIKKFFGVTLLPPEYIVERGEISMSYKETDGTTLDLSASGRGLQQTLLLLAHLYANPDTALLLDEPDAHLEVLRQRQTYQLISEVAEECNSQIIAASHSEVVLNEAADRDVVVAFVGKPHRIDDRGSQVLKALRQFGFEQYYMAEQEGWVLYLEGSTDLAILRSFARTLDHPAAEVMERPFVHYVGNEPNRAREHFYALREAHGSLGGIAIFDRLENGKLQRDTDLVELMWRRRELENYLCTEEVLLAFARHDQPSDLFGLAETDRRKQAMRKAIAEIADALKALRRTDPWSADIKATDDFLDPLFRAYFEELGLPYLMSKTNYHVLAGLVPKEKINPEIVEKLDAIHKVATAAQPLNGL